MKKLAIGLVLSASLLSSPMLGGCGKSECEKQCDKFIKCMKDMTGGKLKENEGEMKKECIKECKKDTKKFKKELKSLCGK